MNSVPLRFNYEFSRIYKRASFANGRYITVHCWKRPKNLKHNLTIVPEKLIRVGFCANKKHLGAVGRNRARRLMREAYRRLEPELRLGYDIVITLRTSEQLPSYSDISNEMEKLFRRLKLFAVEQSHDSKIPDQAD